MNKKTHFTEVEVEDKIAELTNADILRVLKVINIIGGPARTGQEAEDILYEVIQSALELNRKWPIDVDTLSFLIQTVKSYISNEEKKIKRKGIKAEIPVGLKPRKPQFVGHILESIAT